MGPTRVLTQAACLFGLPEILADMNVGVFVLGSLCGDPAPWRFVVKGPWFLQVLTRGVLSLAAYMFVHLSIYLSIYLYIYVCLSMYLPIYLSHPS